ncbi:hypothetical protein [Paenibacillus ehimensis]|nr:hypothetical protein [Paenibacillus ehimensis]
MSQRKLARKTGLTPDTINHTVLKILTVYI